MNQNEISKFAQYLEGRQESAYEFFRRTEIAINTVYKLIRGQPVRKDIAVKVIKFTKNQLTMDDIPICMYQ
jgi:hypothetical protein